MPASSPAAGAAGPAEFHFFCKAGAPVAPAKVARAMSSRGFAVEIAGEAPLHQRQGPVQITVDGAPVTVSFSAIGADHPEWAALRASAGGRPDGEQVLLALKLTDTRVTVRADDPRGVEWARELARSAALLHIGAFENPGAGRFVNFSR